MTSFLNTQLMVYQYSTKQNENFKLERRKKVECHMLYSNIEGSAEFYPAQLMHVSK